MAGVVHCMSLVQGRTLCGADGDYIFLSSALNNPDRVSCAACRAELVKQALEASEH